MFSLEPRCQGLPAPEKATKLLLTAAGGLIRVKPRYRTAPIYKSASNFRAPVFQVHFESALGPSNWVTDNVDDAVNLNKCHRDPCQRVGVTPRPGQIPVWSGRSSCSTQTVPGRYTRAGTRPVS